jgi:hypothetical protein
VRIMAERFSVSSSRSMSWSIHGHAALPAP